ncbi:MAG: hypothetical protein II401_03520 [Bacteroidales bacterium]|nr:hypothetical protein [Bacteroidales bacterium]
MAQIGYGYGSEFQLLRFMGRHRKKLEEIISNTIGIRGVFDWKDFEYSSHDVNIACDSELKGLSFLKGHSKFDDVYNDYSNYKINKQDTWQNWDAVFTLNGVIYLVEAKAYEEEIGPDNKVHGGQSYDNILRFMKDMLPQLPVSEEWMKRYYQLANRLATTALLQKHGVKAKTLCIYFVNGYRERVEERKIKEVNNKNTSVEKFKMAINKELDELGITEMMVSDLLTPPVFIDAEYDYSNKQ